jgi:hypothetical protein
MTAHTHSFAHWPFDDAVNTAAFCTAGVAERRLPVLRVTHDANGDWQFLDATTEHPGDPVLMCLGCVLEHDPSLAAISDLPLGWSAYRPELGAEWERWEKEAEDDESDDDECKHDECNGEEAERRALANIEEYGLHVIHVAEEGELPPFSYSIGIQRTLGMPELIMIGLRHEVAHVSIHECYAQMKAGADIRTGVRVRELLGGGFECVIAEVSPANIKQYMGWARWLYQGDEFRAWQIVFPSTAGVFPWEPAADDWFRQRQPLLAAGPIEQGR